MEPGNGSFLHSLCQPGCISCDHYDLYGNRNGRKWLCQYISGHSDCYSRAGYHGQWYHVYLCRGKYEPHCYRS